MGEVYRATDTRLKRQVALKVLPATFAADADRVGRFEREAQVLAALNHPNIAAIYGVEEANDTTALVMELVEGETLADRLARGPIPLTEALPVARQIADALETAHDAGIVHRDLKPANIKLRPDGTAKVLDFGLAKAMAAAAWGGGLANSPTVVPAVTTTHAGVILGTAPYMSPEQARGKTLDKRTDIWAFGAVFFEMLTGAVAFPGESVTDVLAAVVTRDPDWSLLPGDVSPAVRHLLQRCLEKDQRQRLRDIGEARVALSSASVGAREDTSKRAPGPHRVARRELVAWSLATLSLLVAGTAIWDRIRARPDGEARPVVFDIVLPPGERLSPQSPPALSPEGRRIAFSMGTVGDSRIWIHSLDSQAPQPVSGTEGGLDPFWAPTGRAIGFFAGGKLKTIALDGSPPHVLCDAPDPRGGSWGAGGDVLFASAGRPLYRVAATGGSPQPLPIADGARDEYSRRYPHFLPDGRRFLYFIYRGPEASRGVYSASLHSEAATHIARADAAAIYTPPGYLLFAREATLLAQRFDIERLKLIGAPSPVAASIRVDTAQLNPYAATANTLVTLGEGTPEVRQLVWLDRKGTQVGSVSQENAYVAVDLSRDSRRAVVEIADLPAPGDIWLVDLQRDTLSRVTSASEADYNPVWAPDGERVLFSSNRESASDLFIADLTRGGEDERILRSSELKFAFDWSLNGRHIVYGTLGDLWMMSLQDRKPVGLLTSRFVERHGQVSPDGQWLAFVSNESGGNEVYVQTFPTPSTKIRISTRGGTHPRWRGDGNELFYIGADGQLMSVTFAPRNTFKPAPPIPLFGGMISPPVIRYPYDVTTDGQRFLVARPVREGTPGRMRVTLDWTAQLPR